MLSVYKHKEAYHAEERRLKEKFNADPAAPGDAHLKLRRHRRDRHPAIARVGDPFPKVH
jgi:hypothetical protein